jgi:hypothetical protein
MTWRKVIHVANWQARALFLGACPPLPRHYFGIATMGRSVAIVPPRKWLRIRQLQASFDRPIAALLTMTRRSCNPPDQHQGSLARRAE